MNRVETFWRGMTQRRWGTWFRPYDLLIVWNPIWWALALLTYYRSEHEDND